MSQVYPELQWELSPQLAPDPPALHSPFTQKYPFWQSELSPQSVVHWQEPVHKYPPLQSVSASQLSVTSFNYSI